ncbi:LPS export ABC transporter permease LptF [Sphingomonas sanguinis]|jgi:lipopolysaccharide export system permease protein|uniref:LPS export ABC transporter permease LptF n=2 Tax=Sphingomonas sanguinis TaxID=33051 RepID=A0A7Y7QV50_9SPHN|nr:LPS export ABC transporter permease LptF [Sphingomonas sanguinis]MBZ6381939.1 LPS export ABC transporter permease LptF [Sphingomonas sanguinis]NVP31239.1 LPS export ABC transporter permease LptF [Sphingomonas sanguinis]
MKSIDRYMARLIALPLFATLLISAMLLVLDRIRRLFEFVATEGGPISVVWRMLANLLPEYLGLGIPIGLMLGILLAFRRLATSSELDVMRGVGMSYTRLLRVPYMYAIVLAALNFAIVGYIQPVARYYYEGLRYELRTGALGASIKVGEFTHLGDRMTLRIEESRENGRDLSGIFVHANTSKGDWIGVTAQRGRFLATDDPNVIIFRLTNGTLIHNRPEFMAPRVLTFSSHDLPIDLPKFDNFRQRGGRDLEFTLPELARHGQEAQSAEARAGSRSEFHFRVVEVVTMFLLPLLAVSLGIPPKRSTSALGVFLSIVMLVTYFKVNQYAADIGALGRVNPILALWGPFAVFAGLVLWMYYVTAYVPGGQPIGALERGVAKLAKAIGRWIPGRRRKKAYTA